ncbi:MAG TPA: hypothetical protein VGP12_02415, partial [Nitrosospira sp.]|nr:hypothetical protein [Nitrosospira sp.]
MDIKSFRLGTARFTMLLRICLAKTGAFDAALIFIPFRGHRNGRGLELVRFGHESLTIWTG